MLCHPIVAFTALHTRMAEPREQTDYCQKSVASKALFAAPIIRWNLLNVGPMWTQQHSLHQIFVKLTVGIERVTSPHGDVDI